MFERVNDKGQQVYLESKLKNNLSGFLSLEEFFSPSFGTKSDILIVLVVRLYCNAILRPPIAQPGSLKGCSVKTIFNQVYNGSELSSDYCLTPRCVKSCITTMQPSV